MALLTTYDVPTNKDLFKKLVRDVYANADRDAIVEHEAVVKTIKTSDWYEREYRIGGLEYPGAKGESTPVTFTTPATGSVKDFTQTVWALGFRASWEMKKYNKWDLIAKFTRMLKANMLEGRDVNIMRLYNYPVATTYAAGFDTLALGHDTHTCLDGSTYDNLTTSALSVTSLESAKIYFKSLKDDAGHTFTADPKQLVVPRELEVTALQLTQSSLVPHELSNTKNIIPSWGLKVKTCVRLTDANNWFLIGDTGDDKFGPRAYLSQEPDLRVEDAYDHSRDTVVSAIMAFTYGITYQNLVYVGSV